MTGAPPRELTARANDDDPFAVFSGLGPRLGLMLLLAALAVAVVWFSRRQSSRGQRRSARGKARPSWADPQWRKAVDEVRARPPSELASAREGPIRIVGVLTSAPENLGGAVGRECVWRNQSGAGNETAIAAELVFVADDTGRAAIENLVAARVIAPSETAGRDRKFTALYLGDRVEVIAVFTPEKVGDDPDPRNLVYGTLGAVGLVEIRVDDRPSATPEPAAPTPSDSPERGTDP